MTTPLQSQPEDQAVTKSRRITPTLPAAYYCSEDVFAAERQAIFRSAWQYVGHVSMASNPGDYFTASVVGAEVVLVRGDDGTLQSFYNACQHRGHRLKDGAGHCTHLICPYHAWSYNLDGSLQRAPHATSLDGFDRGKAALRTIRMEIFHDLIFVTTDSNAQTLKVQAAGLGA